MNDYEKQFEQIVAGLNIDDRPNAEHKETLRKQILAARKETSSDKTALRIQPVWRKIMKSNITKSTAAAVIVLGVFIFLTQGNGTGLAWADVVEQIKEFRPYECTRTTYYDEVKRYSAKVMHLTLSQRREERDYGDILVFDMRECPIRTLAVNDGKKYARLTIDHSMGPAQDPDILLMLSKMKESDAQRLDVCEINSVRAQGFHTVDEHNDITIWADVKTGIPVKLEVIHLKHSRKIVFEDFAFNAVFDPALFLTEPPKDYEIDERVIGMEMKASIVTKEYIRNNTTMPVYVIKSGLSWTKEPFVIESGDPTAPGEKLYLSAAVGSNGRHIVLGQSVIYKNLKNQMRGGNKCLEMNGFTVWNGGPEKWYSKTMLESAADMIPPGISEDRTGYAVETPQNTIIIVGISGKLTDNELKELVENLELCKEAAADNPSNAETAPSLMSKEALEAKIKKAEQSEDKESAMLNLALALSGKKVTPEERAAALRMLKLNEKDLISGLANYAKLSGGVFPDSLDNKELLPVLEKLASAKGLTEEEMKSPGYEVFYAGAFYGKLQREKKEPSYTSGLSFSDSPQTTELLRWNADKGGFRVVYTDLSIETVNP
ncbi:MAG: hypothetical protein H8E62_01210 [Planctomycetes bacterium]|nr:hypothetical protein [Planctomycetota bacterium]